MSTLANDTPGAVLAPPHGRRRNASEVVLARALKAFERNASDRSEALGAAPAVLVRAHDDRRARGDRGPDVHITHVRAVAPDTRRLVSGRCGDVCRATQ